MIQIEQSHVVKRPVEHVFAFAAHPENNPKWWEPIVDSKLLTAEPIQKGTRFREVGKSPMGPVETVFEVTVYEPPRQATYKVVSGPIPAEVIQTFEPVEGGTRLTVRVQLQPRGLIGLLLPLMRRRLSQSWKRSLVTLQGLLEARP